MIKKIVLAFAIAAPFASSSIIAYPTCNPCKVVPTSHQNQPLAKTVVHIAGAQNR